MNLSFKGSKIRLGVLTAISVAAVVTLAPVALADVCAGGTTSGAANCNVNLSLDTGNTGGTGSTGNGGSSGNGGTTGSAVAGDGPGGNAGNGGDGAIGGGNGGGAGGGGSAGGSGNFSGATTDGPGTTSSSTPKSGTGGGGASAAAVTSSSTSSGAGSASASSSVLSAGSESQPNSSVAPVSAPECASCGGGIGVESTHNVALFNIAPQTQPASSAARVRPSNQPTGLALSIGLFILGLMLFAPAKRLLAKVVLAKASGERTYR